MVEAGSGFVDLSVRRRRQRRGSRCEACELELGARVRCNGRVVQIERIRLAPADASVTVVAEGAEMRFGWHDVVDVVDAADVVRTASALDA